MMKWEIILENFFYENSHFICKMNVISDVCYLVYELVCFIYHLLIKNLKGKTLLTL